jgi:predicted nucleotide-binding protein (sugar kinase/HSP70/actin superfamily)
MGVINIGVLSMDDESSFSDLGDKFFLNGWIALLIADAVHDIENVISVLAENKNSALELLETGWNRFIDCLESGNEKTIFSGLQEFSEALTAIKLKNSLEETKTVSLVGEIYVRREEFSRGDLVKTLMANGFVVKTAPITEYIYYSNYLLKKGIVNDTGIKEKAKIFIKDFYQKHYEKKIKKILSKSGLYRYEEVDIDKTISCGKNLVSEKLVGETILTAGLSLREILDDACGVISIGPFNCMPSRLSEALLNKEMTLEGKHRSKGIKRNGYPEELSALPFLYVESDGNPFPQITQSRIEVFMLQATKVHNALNRKRNKKLKGHKNLFSLQTS